MIGRQTDIGKWINIHYADEANKVFGRTYWYLENNDCLGEELKGSYISLCVSFHYLNS